MKKFIVGLYFACELIVAILAVITFSFKDYEYTGAVWLGRMFIPTAVLDSALFF